MKNNPNPLPATEATEPLDVMRKTLQDAGVEFEENNGLLSFHLGLKNLNITLLCWGRPDDVATVIVCLPVRATEGFRASTGEFLHRLNYDAKRKLWEMDYNDGEIRLVATIDTIVGPLTEDVFRSLLTFLTGTADVVFPYLTSILSGRMKPEFAVDQAHAALGAHWKEE